MDAMEYPLYGSTFTLHRASPLYHGSDHVFDNLDLHARRLREYVAGDRARSALLTDLQPELAGTGGLESCQWSLLGDEATWERQQEDPETIQTTTRNARGINIQLKFERAKYSAVLLGDRAKMSATPGFTSLPLILMRMPVALREVFLDFLATSFDTRTSPLKLRSSFLSSCLEGLLEQTVAEDDEDPALSLDALSKGVGLQLSFPSAAPHLKNIDLTISKDDIREFQNRGAALWRQYQARHSNEKSQWAARPSSNITGSFTAALSAYLSNHIAMELDNPAIVLSKVALGPFALAGEGKVKVLATSAASVQFWDMLIHDAYGSGMEVLEKTPAVAPKDGARGPSRKARLTSVPSEPPPPYELHDPARQLR